MKFYSFNKRPMVGKMKDKQIIEKIKYEGVQFCLNTSLHGWKFAILTSTKYGSILWIIICFAALITALSLLLTAWFIFQEMPAITVTESTQHFIYNYPFPAVTVCNFNKVSKQAAIAFGRSIVTGDNITTEQAVESLKSLIYTINSDNYNIDKEKISIFEDILHRNNKTIDEIFEAVSPSCYTLLKRCIWKGDELRCNEIFRKIKTPHGYCCSFNYVQPNKKTKHPKKPKRVSGIGSQSALEVLIDSNQEDYFVTEIPSIGYRVLIHETYKFPSADIVNIFCAMRTNTLIGVTPITTVATSGLRRIPLEKRNCIFSDEKDLNYLHVNSFHNCMVEYKIKSTYSKCGCIPFYIPKTDIDLKMCTPKDVFCLLNYDDFYEKEHNRVIDQECMEDCESTFYKAVSYQGTMDAQYTNRFATYDKASLKNYTVIRVFFEDLYEELYRREILFTWYTILAYYGGILGLFTGFSFISLVEIVYFFTRKLFTRINANKQAAIVNVHPVKPPNSFRHQINTLDKPENNKKY